MYANLSEFNKTSNSGFYLSVFILNFLGIVLKCITRYVVWRKSAFLTSEDPEEMPSQYTLELFLVGREHQPLGISILELHNFSLDVHNIVTPPKHFYLSIKKKSKDSGKIVLVSFFFPLPAGKILVYIVLPFLEIPTCV